MQDEWIDNTWRKQSKTPDSVKAVWMENIGGGVGALGLASTLSYWASGGNWWTVLAWGLTMGIATGSALMLARSAIDEIVDWHDYRVMIADIEALEEANDLLEQRCAALQRNLTAAEVYAPYQASRPPNAMRTDRNGAPMPALAPTPIRNDAKRLIQLHFDAGVWPAKDASCKKLAWTTTQWAEARDELQRHGVVVTQGKRTIVLVSSLAEALLLLDGEKASR